MIRFWPARLLVYRLDCQWCTADKRPDATEQTSNNSASVRVERHKVNLRVLSRVTGRSFAFWPLTSSCRCASYLFPLTYLFSLFPHLLFHSTHVGPNMSLLTPPRTAHRSDKENRFPVASGSRVVWSQHQQIHDLTLSPKPLKCSSAKRGPPMRSILKSSSYPLLPLLDVKPREETPEPEDPLMDLHYLEGPVITIVSPLATMQELNEAYGRLMSRLRAAVLNSTDADASWPLFQPIRQCKSEFVAAIVRDLRRALEDPAEKYPLRPQDEDLCDAKAVSCFPSPKQSPKKKKGMSAEQVKYARDLCTTSHSAMKFLAMVMGLPAVYKIFTSSLYARFSHSLIQVDHHKL